MSTITLPPSVRDVLEKFHENGFEAYVVGGSVRDLLLGVPTGDFDFTTNATPEQIQKIFPDSFYENAFGTVGVKIEDDKIFEVTTFRSEQGYSDRRHPDVVVWGKTLEDDLRRRDFTINAMAIDYKHNLIDIFDGQKDLQNKTIRTVGDPTERFSEDALRLLRAVRFSAQLGFNIEEKTFQAITKNVPLISHISGERIRDELLKILGSPFPFEGMMFLHQTGLLKEILPELESCFGVPQKSPGRHHIYDVGMHCFLSLKNCPSPDPIVKLATLLHDIGKAKTYRKLDSGTITFYNHEVVSARMAKNIADRLRLSKEQKDKLWTLVRWHQFTVDEHQTDSAIRRFIRRVGANKIKDMIDLRIGDRLGGGIQTATSWRLQLYMKRIIDVQKHTPSVKDLKVNGNDVMKTLGIKPGPKIGEILEKLFKEITNDPTKNDREYLLKRIKKLA